jgi:pyruvate ferredoxin oxidoreductase gamma subunit
VVVVRELTEIRWHARAGQGAKTAAQALALAALADGKSVQTFPEYGPERRGAPLRAYTRVSDSPIRRHDGITDPDLVVVLESSLVHEASVAEGLKAGGEILVNGEQVPTELDGLAVRCVPASRLATAHGSSFVNLVMLGAVAAALGSLPLELVQQAAIEMLGRKLGAEAISAAVAEGHAWLN